MFMCDQPYTKCGIQICGYLNINISSDSRWQTIGVLCGMESGWY